jgi:hypothetical protein
MKSNQISTKTYMLLFREEKEETIFLLKNKKDKYSFIVEVYTIQSKW